MQLTCAPPLSTPAPTGHSLGGAVATLCTVRLLDALPEALHHTVSCIGFAVPPVGNAQLAAVAQECGWGRRITNYTLPEDFVPGLMGLFGRQGEGVADAADTAASSGALAPAAPNSGQNHERVCCGYASSTLGPGLGRRAAGAAAAAQGAAAAA